RSHGARRAAQRARRSPGCRRQARAVSRGRAPGDHADTREPRVIEVEDRSRDLAVAPPVPPDDDALLDAYSRAVVGVVERAGAAVVSLAVGAQRGKHPGGAGSGFVVTPDGYVMTNSHVVSGARAIRISTQAGEVADAQIVGDDPASDLALLKVE